MTQLSYIVSEFDSCRKISHIVERIYLQRMAAASEAS